jgi:hypothetical protein
MHSQQLLTGFKAAVAKQKDTVSVASLTAQEVQDIRTDPLKKVRMLLDEVCAVRNA